MSRHFSTLISVGHSFFILDVLCHTSYMLDGRDASAQIFNIQRRVVESLALSLQCK